MPTEQFLVKIRNGCVGLVGILGIAGKILTFASIETLKMIREIFERNPNIIINTDIDGFLSGIILQKYCGAKIVGFSNSKKEIWVAPEVNSIYDPVYVDLYVVKPEVVCIEQHIIAHNDEHLRQIRTLDTKINPNLERGKTFTGDYYHKYPFGTVHYLIALLAREGIEVALPPLGEIVSVPNTHMKTSLGQVLLRADDALYSSQSAYADNADDWWKYLYNTSNSQALKQIVDYIHSLDKGQAYTYKKDIGDFFKSLGCDGNDGAFENIMELDGSLQGRVRNFYDSILFIMREGNMPPLPARLVLHEGIFKRYFMKRDSDIAFLSDPRMYSYAYIYSPSKDLNLSFTYDMR